MRFSVTGPRGQTPNAPDMPSPRPLPIFYIHSPITYTVAQRVIASKKLVDPIIIAGRRMPIAGSHVQVDDDGVRNPGRACALLRALFDVIDTRPPSPLELYLPHTGLMLGKLVRSAKVFSSFYYIEEGTHAVDYWRQFVNISVGDWQVDIAQLEAILRETGLLERLQIDDLNEVNRCGAVWFDSRSPRYGGAYAAVSSSFPDMKKVTLFRNWAQMRTLPLPDTWLCMVPMIFELLLSCPDNERRYAYARKMIDTVAQIHAKAQAAGKLLVVKLHPIDYQRLPDEIKTALIGAAFDFPTFMAQMPLDTNLEAALLGFEHFFTIGESTAVRYVSAFRDASEHTHIDFPARP